MLRLRDDIVYGSTKTYCHSVGLSVAFRQWRAESHCRFIHGYALEVTLSFEADELNNNHWVVDFGSFKGLKVWLEDMFDHKLLVAQDDPERYRLECLALQRSGVIATGEPGTSPVADVRIVPATGCEAFAYLIYETAGKWLAANGYTPRCRLAKVEVKEHGGNSAFVRRRQNDA